MMSPWRAPTAMRMPISWVRSVTETSMMFITPMPPTTSEMTAMEEMRMEKTWTLCEMALRRLSLLKREKSWLPWRRVRMRVMASSATAGLALSLMRRMMLETLLRPSRRFIAAV